MSFRGDFADEHQVVAPPVLGKMPSSLDDIDPEELPPTVYLPAESLSIEDEHARLELRYTTNGALALVTYTSVERLVASCGENQTWVAVPGKELLAVAHQTGAEVVLEDVPLPATGQTEDEQ